MKILLCTKHDLVGNMMLNALLPTLLPHHQVAVLLANRRRPELEAIPELAWMKFFEQDLTAQVLFPLIDQATPQLNHPLPSQRLSFSGLAQAYDVPFTIAGHIPHSQWLTDYVITQAPDLIVSFQFGFIFKDIVLTMPKFGAINLHSGLLPERAGVNPTFWCMKDGDVDMGCSLHRMDTGIDAGPLLANSRRAIDYGRSFFANWWRNYTDGIPLIQQAIQTLDDGHTWITTPQDMRRLRYVPIPTRADVLAFLTDGHRLIDPEDLMTVLRAYLPHPFGATPPSPTI